jgi:hypothetical protein
MKSKVPADVRNITSMAGEQHYTQISTLESATDLIWDDDVSGPSLPPIKRPFRKLQFV